jgi:hypothetical protein
MSTPNASNKKNECYYEYILGQYCTQLNTALPICIIHSLSYLVNMTFSGAKISREQIMKILVAGVSFQVLYKFILVETLFLDEFG